MNSSRTALVAIATSLVLGGCAHGVMRGSVAMKTDDEAHVCMGNKELKAGDRVTLYKNVCTGGKPKMGESQCQKERLGEGTVTRVLNEHYSAVKVDQGVQFEEGAIVEKN